MKIASSSGDSLSPSSSPSSSLTWRTQLWFIALGYVAVFAVSAVILLARYLHEVTHPTDVAAYGGMYAGGDALLGIFIICLFMVPTVFLVWTAAKFEGGYTAYSQLLVGISLTAPLCLCMFVFGKSHLTEHLADLYLCRFIASPFILFGMLFSRLVARFDRAKRLTTYALLIEGVTLGIAITMLFRR